MPFKYIHAITFVCIHGRTYLHAHTHTHIYIFQTCIHSWNELTARYLRHYPQKVHPRCQNCQKESTASASAHRYIYVWAHTGKHCVRFNFRNRLLNFLDSSSSKAQSHVELNFKETYNSLQSGCVVGRFVDWAFGRIFVGIFNSHWCQGPCDLFNTSVFGPSVTILWSRGVLT